MTVTSLLSHAVEARPGFWSWQLDPFVLIGVAAAALLYGRAFRRVRRSRSVSAFPTRRGICFMAGLGVVAIALLSPVDAYAEFLLSVHMTQHVLLTMVAAPLLVLGAPITLALAATSAHGGRRIVLRVLRGRFVRVVGSPVFAWVAFFAVMWAWHLPALYDAALRNDGVHAVE